MEGKIVFNIDVMLAKRKMSVSELADKVGITLANMSILKFIRHIYDKYGFPVARKIKTKTACDIVYVIMKPLEWFFLCMIYLNDAKPEDRIAVQYMPGYRNFQKKMREKV